jgi:hypothetical protein
MGVAVTGLRGADIGNQTCGLPEDELAQRYGAGEFVAPRIHDIDGVNRLAPGPYCIDAFVGEASRIKLHAAVELDLSIQCHRVRLAFRVALAVENSVCHLGSELEV